MAGLVQSRREQNKLEKRGRIIGAARALFSVKGFDAATIQEIAEAAGIATSTVFLYAKTKDDLLILVFHDEMLEVVEDAYAAACKQGGLLDQVIVFFETMVVYHERDLPLARALMRQLGYVTGDDQRTLVRELMRSVYGKLALLVEAAKGKGAIAASSPLLASARSLFAIYYLHLGGMLNGYIDREQFDRDLRTELELLMRGLT